MKNNQEIDKIIKNISNNYTNIIERKTLTELKKPFEWDNGVGSRWCKKLYNYSVVYGNFKTKLYSNNISEKIPIDTLNKFIQNKEKKGNNIIGIYIHSVREDNEQRPISQKIKNLIKINPCSSCGTKSDLICDHKNYLYNDEKVLSLRTQKLEDFQSLCNRCNLLKRQACIYENKNNRLFSANNIPILNILGIFPWEKYAYSSDVIINTFWYDPLEFMDKTKKYYKYKILVVDQLKLRFSKIRV